MSFDEFLGRRLTELLRTAFLLCGTRERAEELTCRVLAEAFPRWTDVSGSGRAFAVLRTGVVRVHLDGPADGGAADDPLGGLTPLRRAALVLSVYCAQTTDEIASALRVTTGDVVDDLARARSGVDAGDLVEQMEAWADAAYAGVTVDRVAERVLDRLESAPAGSGESSCAWLDDPAIAPRVVAPTVRWELPAPEVDEDDDEVDAALADRPRTRVVARLAAAVAAVAAAVAITALVSHRPADPSVPVSAGSSRVAAPAPISTSVDPTPSAGPSLPGTKILRQSYGSGSKVLPGTDYVPASGRQLAVNVVCSGPGSARIGSIVVPSCDGQAVETSVTAAQLRSPLHIIADASTTWRFMLADEPDHGTNGSLTYPVDPLLTGASPSLRVAQASGTGPATVPLVSGTADARVEDLRLLVTCSGAGVSFSSTDARFDGLYTRTCFAGWSYEFDVAAVQVPGTLTVQAAAGTDWRLAVIRS